MTARGLLIMCYRMATPIKTQESYGLRNEVKGIIRMAYKVRIQISRSNRKSRDGRARGSFVDNKKKHIN